MTTNPPTPGDELVERLHPPYVIDHSPATTHAAESWSVTGKGFGMRSYPTEAAAIKAAEEYYGPTPVAEFTIRVFGEHTQMRARARKGGNPGDLLDRAIAALMAERGDLEQCPIHRDEAARSATSEVERTLRSVVSHATGGHLDLADHPSIGLNDICVRISQHHNRIWEGGVEKGRALQSKDHSNG